MFRNILDAVLDDKAAPVIIVLAQVAVLVWAWRKGMTPILWVNVVLASAVILYNVPRLLTAIQYQDSGLRTRVNGGFGLAESLIRLSGPDSELQP
jgi:hypothetical protein